jgi:transcription-repair coupling factor (superfamily II helicase)
MILLPSSEVIMDDEAMNRARSMGRLPEQSVEGSSFPGQEAWLNHFYHELDSLFDYFPSSGIVLLMDSDRIESEIEKLQFKFEKDLEKYREEAENRGAVFPYTEGVRLSEDEIETGLNTHQKIRFNNLAIDTPEQGVTIGVRGAGDVDFDFDLRLTGKGRVSMAPLADRISTWMGQGARTILVCRTEQQAARLEEILNNYEVPIDETIESFYAVSLRKKVHICLGRLSRGFAWEDIGLYVISEDEIFGPKRSRAKKKAEDTGIDWTSFSQLAVGDLVVHEDHGIGMYGGLMRMEIQNKINDFVLIEYAGNDRLYIPADRISVMQKYVGADDKNPRLDQLGGRAWKVVKQKAKKAIMEIARQLVEIYAIRKYREGFSFSRPDNYFREFEATFEYEETADQLKAIDDVLSDMESERPMDRLICGDVGFGKTEVAVRAAFKAVSDGKQAAMLVPTTVLAEQHFETFKERMKPFNIEVDVLSRFKSKKEQNETIARVRSGQVNVLIGTHRILSKDMGFRDLGILIIDEEQRFGVKQKERLKEFRALVDVLALTATPIPRTLHLSLMGVRDLSIIETPPEERLAIQTYLSPYDEGTIKDAIEKEIDRGGQVFFVHNRVQSIDNIAARIKKIVPDARIAIGHGQMKGADLEKTMMRFLKKEIDVLVCTTIIESGLDIPSANTIIINQVERFGLSQIYQLRGRVGRASENAYAYLLLSKKARMTREAEKRLKALMDFSQLGAGIHLAMHDLKIRGGGNILGFSQSGHIASIGYELYLKLTEEAIAELKGEEYQQEINPEINVNLSAYLPEEYVSDIDVRLNIYRRLSSLKEKEDLNKMIDEIKDRFGTPPEAVSNLLKVMEVRLMMKRKSIIRLDVKEDALMFTFFPGANINPGNVVKMVEKKRPRFSLMSDSRLKARIKRTDQLSALSEAKNVIAEFDFI